MKVCHMIVYGFVQGVGYRRFVRHNAIKLGLCGWVRNLPEGTVEIEVVGREDNIEKLVTICKKGPLFAEITTVDVDWEEKAFPYEDFVIRHDTA